MGLPILKNGRWVFGGSLKKPSCLIDIGSYWSWYYYGEKAFDSYQLSETSATMSLMNYDHDAFTIEGVSWVQGESFKVTTAGHGALEVKPNQAFDPDDYMKSPISLKIWKQGICIYSDGVT